MSQLISRACPLSNARLGRAGVNQNAAVILHKIAALSRLLAPV
jgi:hypothetical protein